MGKRLPKEVKRAILWAYLDGWPPSYIGRVLGVSSSSLYAVLTRNPDVHRKKGEEMHRRPVELLTESMERLHNEMQTNVRVMSADDDVDQQPAAQEQSQPQVTNNVKVEKSDLTDALMEMFDRLTKPSAD